MLLANDLLVGFTLLLLNIALLRGTVRQMAIIYENQMPSAISTFDEIQTGAITKTTDFS
jgi:hypothetical protein